MVQGGQGRIQEGSVRMGDVNKTVADLNPRSQAVKTNEMTVLRVLGLIELWDDEIIRDRFHGWNDWTDIDPKKYYKILGERSYSNQAVLIEAFKRYKDKTLHRQVLDLYDNLPPKAQQRKEIKNGIANINKEFNR
jgi:hypothetical protein